MRSLLDAGDPQGEVAAAWVAKEHLRDVYRARDEAHARRRMIAFYIHCADAEIPELNRLARTASRWAEQILAYHRTGKASNGRVENTHMLAEKIRRNAHGFTNHDDYRRRLIGRLGIKWHTPLPPPHEYEAANHTQPRRAPDTPFLLESATARGWSLTLLVLGNRAVFDRRQVLSFHPATTP